MTEATPGDRAASFELVAEAVRLRLDAQRQAAERIETKAAILLGFVATAVPLLATQEGAENWLRIPAFVVYGLATIFGVVAIRPYPHWETPLPRPFVAAFLKYPQPPENVSKWLAAARVRTFEDNLPVARQKARCWWLSLLALAVAVLLSVFSLTF